MAADQPRRDLLPLCDGPDESDVAREPRQQENAIMKELSSADQSAKQFSERASEEAENRDVLSEELSEAVQCRWMTEDTIYAALQKAKLEVHHFEHEVVIQKEASAKAEQAGHNLARSLSEFQAEAKAHNEAKSQQAAEEAEEAKAEDFVPLTPSQFIAQLGISKLKSNCQYPEERVKPTMRHCGGDWWWELSQNRSRSG